MQAQKSPSKLFSQVSDYCRENKRATSLLLVAATDYADSRCLILNGLLGGLVSGSQAIEKLLKAFLLFDDPSANVKKMSHSLPKLVKEVQSKYSHLNLSPYLSTCEKFDRHYATRYPDNSNASLSKSSEDLMELDDLVIFLNENLPCPKHVRYRTGLYSYITFSLGIAATVSPWEFWIKDQNHALLPLVPSINAEARRVIMELYPDQDEARLFA